MAKLDCNVVILKVLVLLSAGLLPLGNAISAPMQRFATVAQRIVSPAPTTKSSMDLDWTAPPPCPDGDAVRMDVSRLRGTSASGSRHLRAQASIRSAEGTGWILSLTTDLDGVKGERSLSGSSCKSLAEAAALMLALILNPDLEVAAPPAVATPEPTPVVAAVATVNDRWPSPRWRVGAHAGIQTGVLAVSSWPVALSLDVVLGRLSLRVMPSLTLPENVYLDTGVGIGGRLWLGAVAALGCFRASVGPAVLSSCLGIEVTRLHGQGLGVLQPREETIYWTSAEPAVLVGLPVWRGALLELGAMGLVPFARPSVYLDGIGQVSRPALFGVRALGGFAWVFD
jgi:hypothetical protein